MLPPPVNLCNLNKTQEALAALLNEKGEIEARAANLACAGDKICAELKRNVNQAVQAAREAEMNADFLRAKLDRCTHADDRSTAVVTEKEAKYNSVAAGALAGVMQGGRLEAVDGAERRADVKPRDAGTEMGQLREELGHARETDGELLEGVDALSKRCTELDGGLPDLKAAAEAAVPFEQQILEHRPKARSRGVAASVATTCSYAEVKRDSYRNDIWHAEGNAVKDITTSDAACVDDGLVSGARDGAEAGVATMADTREGGGSQKAFAEAELRDAKVSSPIGCAEINSLNQHLDQARAAAEAATDRRRKAEKQVCVLKAVILESTRQHELFRARGESRLEGLRQAFEQEQEEGGAQVSQLPKKTFDMSNGYLQFALPGILKLNAVVLRIQVVKVIAHDLGSGIQEYFPEKKLQQPSSLLP